ncbi:cation/H(+) antiporter 28 [Ricinus communis]|uniref:Monovalent cation:proton antiporter, putative n=1 Tax=Ricinus communis TaxID=3988 RepID=B9RVP4_RICCO|nr:cation/H(+) antiporter 28 [Ricinus communis]EEF44620.1 monovalent cation:proton antiporter, putative [Ricinus communis]|eukprot:XP_002517813.1 cation/H(+) antiporter 28 [Ricinus communis]
MAAQKANMNPKSPAQESTCQNFITYTVRNGPGKIVGLILTFILSHLLHHLLRPLSQPRIASDIVIGLLIGNIPWVRDSFDEKFITTLNFVAEFGMICYMFVLGMEMDPYVIFKPPTQPAIIAYAGMVSTFILACSITPFLQYSKQADIGFTLSLSITLSGSGSHILTRIITNLKIGKSDIGKLVIAAGVHSDMISMLLICIGYVFIPPSSRVADISAQFTKALTMSSALLLQTIFAAKVSPVFLNWVNNENPEGKPMKGSHLVLSIAFMVMVCTASPIYGYSPILSAFMAGIFLPSEGRVSKWAVGKINYLLTTIFFPLFFFWMGYHANLHKFEPGQLATWGRFAVLTVIALFGKMVGTVICGAMLGYHWRESAELGLLLTAKGHFHVFLAILLSTFGVTSTSVSCMMVIVIFFTVVHTPSIVMEIIQRARKRAPTHRRALQWLDPSTELRILLCIHGQHNVPSTINFMEISRGTSDPGILVYATDMVELTEQIAATLVQSNGVDTVTVTDKQVTDMRDQITQSIQAYVDENGDGITLRRMLALSTFNSMAQDICILAEDLMISLIILPFHKSQRSDGTLDGGHPGFRYVNRKILRNAPCSVGILVDRGLGLAEKISTMPRSFHVAVIFIGGKDDREALAYAGRVARHPGVKLTVIRFLLDDNSDQISRRAGGFRINQAEQEAEMKLDDECFAHFYERYVAGGHVSYMEKHLANSAETYATLKSLEGQYALIIVGRGGRVNSILTVGMNDWQQCPELGPIGDVLSGSSFSQKTSVLIVQQHHLRGELKGVDDDFSIM